MLLRLTLLAFAGAIGTLSRYGLGTVVQRWHGGNYPWGTFAVNAVGCFGIGLVWSLVEHRGLFHDETRLILVVGFAGAFTTFSSFAFDCAQMLTAGRYLSAAGYVLLQNAAGLALVFAGLAAGRTT